MASDTIKVKLVGDSRSLEKAFRSSQKSGQTWGKSFAGVSKTAVLGIGAVAVAAGAAGYKMLSLASDAQEVQSKLQVVFGKALPGLTKNLDAFAEATGASRYELRQQAADMGALLRPLTGSAKAAADMSAKTVRLATDLGSFNNVPTADALLAIRSGLVGEAEPLRAFGVLLNEAAVKAEALCLGLVKEGEELTEQEKVQARYSLILKQTKLAQGDATRTAGSMANQMKALRNNVTDIATDLGQKLIPVALKVTEALNDFIEWATDNWPTFQAAIQQGIDAVMPHFQKLVDYWNTSLLPTIQSVIEIARSLWARFGEDIKRNLMVAIGIIRNLLNVVKGIIELAMALIRGDWSAAWEAIKSIAKNALGALVKFITNFKDNVFRVAKALGERLKDGIVAGVKGLAGLVSGLVRGAINAVISAIRGFGIPGFKIDPPGPGSFSFPGIHPFAGIPSLDTGGLVTRTGLAQVHRGETFSGVGSASGGPGQFALVWAGPDFIRWMREEDRRQRRGGGSPLMAVLTSSQIVLEWSADPLSDVTPTYVTVSNSEIRSLEWWAGVDREGNEPEPGGMVVRLKNTARKWEPLFAANTIDTQQRFRLTVAGVQEGIFYSQDFALDYPSGQEYSEVTVTCGDGFDVLALDDLPGLDPPDAESYEDVIQSFEPWGYWRLGDPAGTRAAAIVRRHSRGKGKKRRKWKTRHGQRTFTASEAGGVAGPAGVYRNTPSLGQPGLILGDTDASVYLNDNGGTNGQHVAVQADANDFRGTSGFTVMAWAERPAPDASGAHVVVGPLNTTHGTQIFLLEGVATSGVGAFSILDGAGGFVTALDTTAASANTTYFLAGVWDGNAVQIYVDADLRDSIAATSFASGNDGILYMGRSQGPTYQSNCFIDEVAVIERALTAAEIASVYTAGTARGYPQQTAGERIAAIATSDLWAETEIQTAGRDVAPVMQHGQPKLDEIAETMHAEGPRTLFFFNGNGDPVYLGHEFQGTATEYNTVQATFNDDGTGTPYVAEPPDYDSETYNTIVGSREGGPLITVTDTTEAAKRRTRTRTEETDLLLVEDIEVESLLTHVREMYAVPAWRPGAISIDSHHALTQIKALDIGYLVRVKKSGVTGAQSDTVAHIIGKRKAIDGNRLHTATYTLGRGFDGSDGYWHLGVAGFSELGSTTTITG